MAFRLQHSNKSRFYTTTMMSEGCDLCHTFSDDAWAKWTMHMQDSSQCDASKHGNKTIHGLYFVCGSVGQRCWKSEDISCLLQCGTRLAKFLCQNSSQCQSCGWGFSSALTAIFNFGVVIGPKRIQTPHRSFWNFEADNTFSTRWWRLVRQQSSSLSPSSSPCRSSDNHSRRLF